MKPHINNNTNIHKKMAIFIQTMHISSNSNHFRWFLDNRIDEETMKCSFFFISTSRFDDKLPQKHVGDDSFGKFGNPISTRGHVEGDSSDGRFLEHSYHAKAPITQAHGSSPSSLGNTQKIIQSEEKKHKSIIRGVFVGIWLELHMSGSTLKVTLRDGVATTHLAKPLCFFNTKNPPSVG